MAADSLVGESVARAGEVLPQQRRRRTGPARRDARGRRRRVGLLVDRRGLRRAGEAADRGDRSDGPTNPYGETKLAFERALRWYEAAYGLRSASLRYFNAAGATARCGEGHDPETHLSRRAAGGRRDAPARHGLRRRLPDAGRHLRPRLHPRRSIWRARTSSRSRLQGARSARLQPRLRRDGYSVRQVIDTAARVTGSWFPQKSPVAVQAIQPCWSPARTRFGGTLGGSHSTSSSTRSISSAWDWMRSASRPFGRRRRCRRRVVVSRRA